MSGPTLDKYGNIYGLTAPGEEGSLSSIYEIAAGTTSIITRYTFTNSASFRSDLLLGNDGEFYGIAYDGGNYGGRFSYSGSIPDSSAVTNLASFTQATGFNPLGSLVEDASGNFFGTTLRGGSSNDGTVLS